MDLYLGHNGFFAAPSGGASSCGYSPGGRKVPAGLGSWVKVNRMRQELKQLSKEN